MKKLTMMLIAACGILLAACSSNTPTNTVEKAFDAMIKGDYETYVRSFYVEDKSEPEKVEKYGFFMVSFEQSLLFWCKY